MADMLTRLQDLLTAAAPLAGSFTPRPYPGLMPAPGGMAAGNPFAGVPQLAQAGPPGFGQAGTGSLTPPGMAPGAAGWMQPVPQQSATSVDLQQLSKLLRDAGVGTHASSP